MTGEKSPAELLRQEHQSVLLKLDDLEAAIDNLEQKEKISAKLKELTSFFDIEFWVHFEKEEKALFPEFDSFMPPGSGPVAVMLAEHDVLRKTNVELQQAVAKYLNHTDSAEIKRTISQSGMHFIGFLRDHIFKEDSILFRMADMHFDQKQNEKVVKLFAGIEKSKGG